MKSARFSFKPLCQDDLALLEKWLREPHILRWFGNPDEWLSEIKANIRSNWVFYFRADVSGIPSGFTQYYHTELAPEGWWSSEPVNTLGIDFFLGRSEDLGKGFGSRLVREFMEHVEAQIGSHRFIADPNSDNVALIRTLVANGFRFNEKSKLYVCE